MCPEFARSAFTYHEPASLSSQEFICGKEQWPFVPGWRHGNANWWLRFSTAARTTILRDEFQNTTVADKVQEAVTAVKARSEPVGGSTTGGEDPLFARLGELATQAVLTAAAAQRMPDGHGSVAWAWKNLEELTEWIVSPVLPPAAWVTSDELGQLLAGYAAQIGDWRPGSDQLDALLQ